MSEREDIHSLSGKVSPKDGLHWILNGGNLWKAAGISAGVIFFLLLIIVFLENKSLSKFAILKLLHTSLIVFIVTSFSSLICAVGMVFFLKPNQRHVNWSFSTENFILKDKAGNQIITPWTQVKGVNVWHKRCLYLL